MTSVEMRIDRLRHRVDLSATGEGDEARVGQIVSRAIERLADLLGDFGLLDGHWCIKDLHGRLVIDLTETDERIVGTCALELAALVCRAASDGRLHDADGVVWFPSLEAAAADAAIGIAEGRGERAWAWAQLGIVALGEKGDTGAAAVELLKRFPRAAPAVIRSLRVTGSLGRFVASLPDDALVECASIVGRWTVDEIGRRAATLAEVALMSGSRRAEVGALGRRARHVLKQSQVLPRSSPPREVELVSRAILAVAEVEPVWAAGTGPASWACVVDSLVSHMATGSPTADASDRSGPLAEQPIVHREAERAGESVDHSRTPSDEPAVGGPDSATGNRRNNERSAIADSNDVTGPGADARSDAASADDDTAGDEMVGRTEAAGLLYLLNVIDDDLLATWADTEQADFGRLLAGAARTLLADAGSAPDDPAALVFCGQWQVESLPAAAQPAEPVDVHRRFADAVWARFELRLSEAGSAMELAEVIRRPGQVVGTMPWIEVVMPADHVSIDIRRAGLDADPDWVGWLGTVVRFRYV